MPLYKKTTLLIDNYDSFTYNLYQYLAELGGNPVVYKNNQLTLSKIRKIHPSHIVISPGPGTVENPEDFGICSEAILNFGTWIPLLGVCLGHQGICYAFGGKIETAPEIMHGKTSLVTHTQTDIFQGVPNPFEAMRYHSFIASNQNFPPELQITATVQNTDIIMGLKHKKYPISGIQFHPESIGTKKGKKIMQNFLEM